MEEIPKTKHAVSVMNNKRLKFTMFMFMYMLLLSFLGCTISAFFIGNSNQTAIGIHSVAGSIFAILAIIHAINKKRYFINSINQDPNEKIRKKM